MTKNLALLTPFVVLAVVIATFTVTPLLIQHRATQVREHAVVALTSSVRAIERLVDMRVQLHRYASRAPGGDPAEAKLALAALDASFSAYAQSFPSESRELIGALAAFELDAQNARAGMGAVRRSGEHLTTLLMNALAHETERAAAASARLESIRADSLRAANRFNFLWACLAVAGGSVAAVLVRRHQRFSERLRQLEQDRAAELEQFSNRVAHDILSPLGSIPVGLHVLGRKLAGDGQGQTVVRSMRRAVQRVESIVDELLRFARSGARSEPGESADLTGVMSGLREELTPAAEERGVTLVFHAAPPVRVACSEGALLVVLQNLVRNAIKYVGGGREKVVVVKAASAGGRVRLSVDDSGPGIPPGMERSVFDPYVRAKGLREPGIGLGLATVKRIVEARLGRVGVISDPGRGARFWVDLAIAHG